MTKSKILSHNLLLTLQKSMLIIQAHVARVLRVPIFSSFF